MRIDASGHTGFGELDDKVAGACDQVVEFVFDGRDTAGNPHSCNYWGHSRYSVQSLRRA
jgi:hypothetical protein